MRFRALLSASFVVVVLAGCGAPDNSEDSPRAEPKSSPDPHISLDPAQTVTAMLQAYLGKRLGEYYGYVSTRDKRVKSLDSLQAEFAPSSADLVTDFLFAKTKFKVDSVRVLGDSAVVFVTSRSPDITYVMQQARQIERDLGPETAHETKLSILGERHKMSGAPREENKSAYLLRREPGGWRVNVGWADFEEALQSEADPEGGT